MFSNFVPDRDPYPEEYQSVSSTIEPRRISQYCQPYCLQIEQSYHFHGFRNGADIEVVAISDERSRHNVPETFQNRPVVIWNPNMETRDVEDVSEFYQSPLAYLIPPYGHFVNVDVYRAWIVWTEERLKLCAIRLRETYDNVFLVSASLCEPRISIWAFGVEWMHPDVPPFPETVAKLDPTFPLDIDIRIEIVNALPPAPFGYDILGYHPEKMTLDYSLPLLGVEEQDVGYYQRDGVCLTVGSPIQYANRPGIYSIGCFLDESGDYTTDASKVKYAVSCCHGLPSDHIQVFSVCVNQIMESFVNLYKLGTRLTSEVREGEVANIRKPFEHICFLDASILELAPDPGVSIHPEWSFGVDDRSRRLEIKSVISAFSLLLKGSPIYVVKKGCRTGITTGLIGERAVFVSQKLEHYGTLNRTAHHVLLVQSTSDAKYFATYGDSGSPVITWDNELVGFVCGAVKKEVCSHLNHERKKKEFIVVSLADSILVWAKDKISDSLLQQTQASSSTNQ